MAEQLISLKLNLIYPSVLLLAYQLLLLYLQHFLSAPKNFCQHRLDASGYCPEKSEICYSQIYLQEIYICLLFCSNVNSHYLPLVNYKWGY